jgi:hypothetical protein
MVRPPIKSRIERATAIRDHLVPLIQAASATHEASGVGTLLFMIAGFTITYRPIKDGMCMEVWRRKPLMQIEWNDTAVKLVSFKPGGWERTIMELHET